MNSSITSSSSPTRKQLKISRFKNEMTDIIICPDGETCIHMFVDDGLHVVVVVTKKGIKVKKCHPRNLGKILDSL